MPRRLLPVPPALRRGVALAASMLGVWWLAGCEQLRPPNAASEAAARATTTSSSAAFRSSWESEEEAAAAPDPEELACKGVFDRFDSLGEYPARPPLTTYFFDIRLRNPISEHRWLIVPTRLPPEGRDEPAPGRGNVDRVQVERLDGRGRVIALSANGPNGFRAFHMPPGAKLTLREVPVLVAVSTPRRTVKLPVLVASDITFDGASIDSLIRGRYTNPLEGEARLDLKPEELLPMSSIFKPRASHSVLISEDCTAVGRAILKHIEH